MSGYRERPGYSACNPGIGQKVLVKQQFAAILAKGESSGVQGNSGQDFVLHTLILRV